MMGWITVHISGASLLTESRRMMVVVGSRRCPLSQQKDSKRTTVGVGVGFSEDNFRRRCRRLVMLLYRSFRKCGEEQEYLARRVLWFRFTSKIGSVFQDPQCESRREWKLKCHRGPNRTCQCKTLHYRATHQRRCQPWESGHRRDRCRTETFV